MARGRLDPAVQDLKVAIGTDAADVLPYFWTFVYIRSMGRFRPFATATAAVPRTKQSSKATTDNLRMALCPP